MAETVDQIKHHIELQRGRLAQNVNELESRVRETVDWRIQFRRHTGLALGLAFGFGMLLSLIMSGPGRGRGMPRPYGSGA